MKKILHFRTPLGVVYKVNAKGELARKGVCYSGDWIFVGLHHVRYNRIIFFNGLTEAFVKDFNPKYKNGNPAYTVCDIDHGTRRIWGNTKYHGVSELWYE